MASVLILSLVTPVTPSNILSSDAVEVTFSSLLMSPADAVIAVPPRVKLVTSISPLTTNLLVERVKRSAVVL